MEKIWFTANELANRWGANKPTLLDVISTTGLKAYHPDFKTYYEPDVLIDKVANTLFFDPTWPGLSGLYFYAEEVYSVEKKWNVDFTESTQELNAKERRELGQLRREKQKWDYSIRAAVLAALYCGNQEQPVTRKQLQNELYQNGFKELHDSVFEKIWNTIPEKYRSSGGRPKKIIKIDDLKSDS
jgi:hypothetical protein